MNLAVVAGSINYEIHDRGSNGWYGHKFDGRPLSFDRYFS